MIRVLTYKCPKSRSTKQYGFTFWKIFQYVKKGSLFEHKAKKKPQPIINHVDEVSSWGAVCRLGEAIQGAQQHTSVIRPLRRRRRVLAGNARALGPCGTKNAVYCRRHMTNSLLSCGIGRALEVIGDQLLALNSPQNYLILSDHTHKTTAQIFGSFGATSLDPVSSIGLLPQSAATAVGQQIRT